jgi:hypothetical protein
MSFDEYKTKPYKTEFTRSLVQELNQLRAQVSFQKAGTYNEAELNYYNQCYEILLTTIRFIEKVDGEIP